MKPLVIDLFCGAGGMSEGIIQSGFHIIFSNDKSQEASLTYKNRHEELGLQHGYNTFFENNDISNVTGDYINQKISELPIFSNKSIPKIKVIFGGPPCQGFSRAGKRKQDDPRNFLFREYIRIISEIKPEYVVMENVLGLLDTKLSGFNSFDGSLYPENYPITKILEQEFIKLGYLIKNPDDSIENINFKKLKLDASEFGVPQKRERVIIIAYRKDVAKPNDVNSYKIEKQVTLGEAIVDLIKDTSLKTKITKKFKKEGKFDYVNESKVGRTNHIDHGCPIDHSQFAPNNYEFSDHSIHIIERFSLYKEGESSNQLKDRLKKEGIHELEKIKKLIEFTFNKIDKKLFGYTQVSDFEVELKNLHQFNSEKQDLLLTELLSKKNLRTKLNNNQPSRTVVTLPDDFISPFENRILSVRELARVQSFDDSFVFLGKRTTGGLRRRDEVPQYTQVGNAVPPLLAKAIAKSIIDVIE